METAAAELHAALEKLRLHSPSIFRSTLDPFAASLAKYVEATEHRLSLVEHAAARLEKLPAPEVLDMLLDATPCPDIDIDVPTLHEAPL